MTEHSIKHIDFLRAAQNACLKCGNRHKSDCPVGLVRAKINSTDDLLTEFYSNL